MRFLRISKLATLVGAGASVGGLGTGQVADWQPIIKNSGVKL